jgi:CubicO group peptidase (beta-lactamase class C family)
MTKSVLGALVGVLVGEGRLTLLDAAHAWRHPDPRAAIAIEDPLRMRSGLGLEEHEPDIGCDRDAVQPGRAAVRQRPLIAPRA